MTGIEYQEKRIPCRLIIFDKDGTLIDFTATWVPLIRKRVSFLLKRLGKNGELEAFLLKSWGIDPVSGKVDPRGPCPVSPRSDEIIIGTMALYQHGYHWDESKQWVSHAFDEADADGDWRQNVVPIKGIQTFLSYLKGNGFHTALATNDERKDTEAILNHLSMDGLFDVVLCSGEVNPAKPHPETILTICRKLSVSPNEVVMVGDSVTDMMMGKRAGVALTVGILEGGVTPKEELEKVADLVVDSIQDLKFY
ncbi:MAG: HAD family hydrolase [Thermodesulfobacteriota bacterium]|nr:HAD family hydrolase [Thermodesulfobacteriota bacterium]